MKNQEFFEEIGYTQYEAKTLASLIKLTSATPKEISLDASIPQNKLYNILNKFYNQGIVALTSNEPKRYKLINLNTNIKSRLNEKQDKLKELAFTFKNLGKIKKNEENCEFMLIKGQKAIMNKLAEANNIAKKEILGIQRNWKYWGEGVRTIARTIKRNVKVKMIGVINNETMNRAREWEKAGCNIRAYNNKFGNEPLRFSIIDRKYARITIGKPEIKEPNNYITIWTDSKPIINLLIRQFQEVWSGCKPIG